MSPKIRLFERDCIKGMNRQLKPESIDLVVTSPPYNLGVDYNQYDDTDSRERYLDWLYDWGQAVREVLSTDGSLFLNLGSKPTDPWVPHQVVLRLRDLFELQNEIHWVKSIAVQQKSYDEEVSVNVGHYKPINSGRFVNQCHEYVFHLTLNGEVPLDRKAIGVPYKDKSNVDRWEDGSDLRCRGNTWFIPYETIHDRNNQRPHPASFPPALAEMAMRLHGLERIQRAMDPFLGIGNSAIAAARLDVDFVGFEVDGQYLNEARRRLQGMQTTLEEFEPE